MSLTPENDGEDGSDGGDCDGHIPDENVPQGFQHGKESSQVGFSVVS